MAYPGALLQRAARRDAFVDVQGPRLEQQE
jgi:hypothetical protein